jgi:hypothetical protein
MSRAEEISSVQRAVTPFKLAREYVSLALWFTRYTVNCTLTVRCELCRMWEDRAERGRRFVNLAPLGSPGTSVIPVIGPIPEALYLLVPAMTFTVTPLMLYTYVYIPVSHVYKLACTLHRIINLLPLVCCTPTFDSYEPGIPARCCNTQIRLFTLLIVTHVISVVLAIVLLLHACCRRTKQPVEIISPLLKATPLVLDHTSRCTRCTR